MGNANAGIHAAEETQRSQHFGIRRDAGAQHCGRKAIERQGRIAAQISVKPPRDPPDASAQQEAGKEKWQAQQQQDVRHLMAQFPSARLAARLLYDAILRLAHEIKPALGQKIQRERKPGQPVRQNAVVNVAAGGVVAGQRRRLFPGLASATRVLVIEVSQCLAADEPESLQQKEGQQGRRDPLRQIESKAAQGLKPVGHANRADVTSLNGGAGKCGHAPDACRGDCN